MDDTVQCLPCCHLRFIDDFAGEWKRHSQVEQRRSRNAVVGSAKAFYPKMFEAVSLDYCISGSLLQGQAGQGSS